MTATKSKQALVNAGRTLMRNTLTYLLLRSPVRSPTWQQSLFGQLSHMGRSGSMALDLGSGPHPRNPFGCEQVTGIDLKASEKVMACDLSIEAIPLDDESVSVITAFDFLEHMPRILASPAGSTRYPFVELMNEIHRVLKPGGIFFSSTPCHPWPMAYSDPTHVNVMTEETISQYFCQPHIWARIYGFTGTFDLIDHGWIGGHHNVLLRKSN